MELSTAQLQTLKAWVQTNANSVYDQNTANLLNALADPAYVVYRTFVPMSEIMANSFDWTRVDNLSTGKARIWEWMEKAYGGGLNPSKAACRDGINAVWVGTAADRLVRDVVYSHSYRSATVAEKLFATGAGTVPVVNGDGSGPGVMGAEGQVTIDNLIAAEGE